jgi:hypothetical protein
LAQRELTYREAYGLTADCIIPFIGSWLVDKTLDAHPEWDPDLAAARQARQARPAHRRAGRRVNSRG